MGMNMDRFQAMDTFVRVVDAGSFSSAARDLRIGQPSVSKIVAGLEERLQVRLLIRSTRRLTPTEAGMAFYERARRAVDEANEAEATARGLGRGLEGRLRVCAPVTFARIHIVPHLASFLDQHPKLRIEFVLDDRNVDLVEENIDVALRLGVLADSALRARKIATAPRHVLASPAYVARHGTPNLPSDLLNHEAIVYGQSLGTNDWRFRKGTAETSVAMSSRLTLTAAEGVREAVFAGMGLTIASRWMFADGLASGQVVDLLPEWSLSPVDLWLLFPAGRLPSTKARAFGEWLEGVIKIK
jgi:DNA-binding transcriptional LysR family regulator